MRVLLVVALGDHDPASPLAMALVVVMSEALDDDE
jgi:hypothetical protein